ncbi:SGNH/GDSL hydrolase family protein [Nocardia aurantia]|uniref:Lipase 2 n=1 Tax=Nocardia aurantia TaxID=2585199 RepID=A0A7K0DMY8_9NOCA|nr:SGNH/GDSL hydrolase family protein [Nocardia aurantia]MQY26194.1 Lipase 2 [Nocardia aurantia]
MPHTLSLRPAVAAACLLTACAAATGTAHAQPIAATLVYVALGDSFSAGVGLDPQAPTPGGLPSVCGRSMVDYPRLVAAALGAAEFRDVSCGGATTANLTGPQPDISEPVPPQFDALTTDTTLVTIGIGGNDIGLEQLAGSCLAPLPSCSAAAAGAGDPVGQRIEGFAPVYGTVVEQVRAHSPRARIVLVGYPTGVRAGGCPDTQPMRSADADYLEAKVEQLDYVMAAQAAAHGATYVDLLPSTRGHDACADPAGTWITGVYPGPGAPIPLHPNAAGHRNAARQILATLGD